MTSLDKQDKWWRDNMLHDYQVEWYYKNPPLCPQCSSVLMPRDGKHGLFFGCCKYPKCSFACGLGQAKTLPQQWDVQQESPLPPIQDTDMPDPDWF